MAVPPASVRVPSQRPLAPSVTSVMSVANDKGNNEMIPGAVYRSPDNCLTAEENPGKPQLGDHFFKWGSLLPMASAGSHSISRREKEGRKEGRRKGRT